MDVALLEQLVSLMAANDLNTVDVRDGDKRVILRRGAVHYPSMAVAPGGSPGLYGPMHAAPHAAQTNPTLPGEANPGAPVNDDANLIAIKSPMVGTFYSSATPEAKPFVSVGTRVDDETDVCIIEAMKVFNNIKAETRGTIARVLISNGQTVEFGQTLFLVKP